MWKVEVEKKQNKCSIPVATTRKLQLNRLKDVVEGAQVKRYKRNVEAAIKAPCKVSFYFAKSVEWPAGAFYPFQIPCPPPSPLPFSFLSIILVLLLLLSCFHYRSFCLILFSLIVNTPDFCSNWSKLSYSYKLLSGTSFSHLSLITFNLQFHSRFSF